MSAEGRLQIKAVRYARHHGLMAKRNYMGPGAETGWPDVEFFAPGGRVIFFEFKAPGKKLRKRQVYIGRRLREIGHEVHTCDDFNAFKEIIDAYR
jgi:hypothetical protein